MLFDYEKNLISKVKLLSEKGDFVITTEIKETQMVKDIWFPISLTNDIEMPVRKIHKEITLENIQINTNVSDNEFNIK